MLIVPVLDLAKGVVVHARGGNRATYAPLQSKLASPATPIALAQQFMRAGCRTLYVADLDALSGAEPQWHVLEELLATGLSLWLDAGVHHVEQGTALLERLAPAMSAETRVRIVVASETLRSVSALATFAQRWPEEQWLFSLDLRGGRVLSRITAWEQGDPWQVLDEVCEVGVREVLVLDVATVGQAGGVPAQSWLLSLRERRPHLVWHTGGGMRQRADLDRLRAAGCRGMLVATALHNGSITLDDLLE
jgi:phosphoribosylformimino-5-aminoimidazole carboxamide ribotide isomerase